MIYIENKRRNIDKIKEQYPNADILDVTSTSTTRYSQILSPFYPHGNVPIPFSPGYYSACVEGIWQGLKVFESCDVDMASFQNTSMAGLKRTVRKFGAPKGHRKGINGTELLNYFDARMLIYLPSYKWVLDNVHEVHDIVMRIKERAKNHDIVFLDYNTNIDFRNISSPLSHAGLIKMYVEDTYPVEGELYLPVETKPREPKKKTLKKRKKNTTIKLKQLNLFDL